MRRIGAIVGIALSIALMPASSAAPAPEADRFDAYFLAGDGLTRLHAEVLRPKGAKRMRTPVVMTVGPYFNQNDLIDPNETGSQRFYDFLDLTKILERGYTYVMVDLPGFGGSGGCNDWGGFREQDAVVSAVEWAAAQSWSTGRVALMGKSYDGWTGLMGIARQPRGLAAVVALEPVYSGYRYLYTNGVRFVNSVLTGPLFQGLDAQPGSSDRSAEYHVNGLPQAWCYGVNVALQQQDDPDVPFWMERDLLPPSIGKRTPLFLTQGFLEDNTKPDAAFDYFASLEGTKRAWLGQFDHVRSWQKVEGRYRAGRKGFVAEVVRFLDRHLKGARVRSDPNVAVQDNLGRYRAERRWPPADSSLWWNRLNAGTYADDGNNAGTGGGGGRGLWSFSQPLAHDVWMAGEPVLHADVETMAPRANLVANVYDVNREGEATMISRGAYLLRDLGRQRASFELYGQDWLVKKGHRLGVLISGSNAEWWLHLQTNTSVTVRSASIGLPFLAQRRQRFLDGESTPKLEDFLGTSFDVESSTIKANDRGFRLPPPLS